ncbi:hypothetical protein G2W53_040875 [Senna tora]|uniref:CCHC-type domain-containing protein n=1 Tax=Senna tora TaxID=362788 RepID=A0A834SQZ3_9FABA|nr:hypothetical protein G2W53_040875 [Senna tora]
MDSSRRCDSGRNDDTTVDRTAVRRWTVIRPVSMGYGGHPPSVLCACENGDVDRWGLRLVCFECGLFGHGKEGCPAKTKHEDKQEKDQKQDQNHQNGVRMSWESQNKVEVGEDNFGPWMIPERRPRRNQRIMQGPQKSMDNSQANINKFRFDVLDNEGEDISKEIAAQVHDENEAQPMDIQASSPSKETRDQKK